MLNERTSHGHTNLDYWTGFYQQQKDLPPSLFAEFCLPKISTSGKLLDLGCGNGRDARLFASNGISVVACDQCEKATQDLLDIENIQVLNCNFLELPHKLPNTTFSTIYSRFSLHAVSEDVALQTLKWCRTSLEPEGTLFIEVRSVLDELYGQGQAVARDAYQTDHFRRFIRQDELNETLVNLGFHIDTSVISRGFAPFQSEDPMIIRVIAKV